MAFVLNQWRGEHSRLKLQELCPASMRSPGAYMRQGSVMKNKGDRILISSSCVVFLKDSHKLVSVTQ